MPIVQLLKQVTNCALERTCGPDFTNPLSALSLYQEFYGIPNAAVLGMFLGIIIGGIYGATRSLVILGILSIYTIGLVGATFLAEAYVAPQYSTLVYLIMMAVASVIVIFFVKLVKD